MYKASFKATLIVILDNMCRHLALFITWLVPFLDQSELRGECILPRHTGSLKNTCNQRLRPPTNMTVNKNIQTAQHQSSFRTSLRFSLSCPARAETKSTQHSYYTYGEKRKCFPSKVIKVFTFVIQRFKFQIFKNPKPPKQTNIFTINDTIKLNE